MFKCSYCNKNKSDYIVRVDITIHQGNCETSWMDGHNYRKKCLDCFIKDVSGVVSPEKRDYTVE